ncbi:MAG: NAD-dependent epimerase/dehydratase family protein [Clostridia bacterium]|nr:NAD-dependent epimerase/dehydratase family protein [Clostridia bacterium]
MINNITDIYTYFKHLYTCRHKLIIILSVKDTPGFSYNKRLDKLLHRLGLKESLINKHWHAYGAVINGGQVTEEKISKDDEPVIFDCKASDTTIKVVSMSYNKGNLSEILINGTNYSQNERGLNIVLLDKNLNTVVDSVCFDTHDPSFKSNRHDVGINHIVEKQLTSVSSSQKNDSLGQKGAPVPTESSSGSAMPSLDASSTLLPEHNIMLHGAFYASGFGGSYLDYFVDQGISEVAIYGTDVFVGWLYQQACAKGVKVLYLLSNREMDVSIRMPKVGTIHLQDIRSVHLDSSIPVVVADTNIPLTLRDWPGVYRITDLNFYSMIKRCLLDPVLEYANAHTELKVVVLNMPHAYDVKNPSEIEKSIITNRRNVHDIIHKVYLDRGFTQDYVHSVLPSIKIISKNGADFVADECSRYRNCASGYRCTTDVPVDFLNTIYVFGNSVAFGVGTDDEHTIESTVQKALNVYYNGNSPYAVLNCANGGSVNILAQYNSLKYHAPSNGDIVVLCMGFGKLLGKVYKDKMIWVETANLFARPHDLGEVFYDSDHMNAIGYETCGKELAHAIISSGLPTRDELESLALNKSSDSNPLLSVDLSPEEESELNAYISDSVRLYKRETEGRVGAIVMNCNPFTLGHRYLVEYASSKVDLLYLFVVEEDRSVFPFADRFELVKKGVADLKNVVVLPSGKFIISQTTFQAYFTKEEKNDITVDPSNDINIFASRIAPAFGITVRFAGEEPIDNVTNQYNATMKRLLPRAGIEFDVIKRKESEGAPISASRVRALLKESNFSEIARITPKTTYDYLYKRFKDSKNVLVLGGTRFMGIRLVEKLIERNDFVTIATRGIHPDNFGKHVTRVIIDRLKEDSIIAAFKGKHYDVVYDTTAYCSNAVKYALSHISCDRYIQVSSTALYGTREVLKKEEMFDPTTSDFKLCDSMENYGIGKRYAECAAFQLFPNVSKAIVRVPFVVETDNLDNKELNLRLYFYAKHIVKELPMALDNFDLECSFVRTTDEAEFLIQIADSGYNGAVNLSSEGMVTVGEIVSYIEEASGHKAVIDPQGDVHPFNAQHFKVGVIFDLTKAKSIGYQPPKLKDWLWPLLDKYIVQLNNV